MAPIIGSLLDTDFYKLLMGQFVWRRHPDVRVTYSIINRSRRVRLAECLDLDEVRAELDAARTLALRRHEAAWLRGNTFAGTSGLFDPAYLEWLGTPRLPPYGLEVRDGQIELTFQGAWPEVMLWEIPALAILMELRSRTVLAGLGPFAADLAVSRAKTRLWHKLERLAQLPDLVIADFGTRRRHAFAYQDWAVQAARAALGPAFAGSSNVLLALRHDLEAIGTNGHELPMVRAALAPDDDALFASPYATVADWQEDYGGGLLVLLPDTFGSDAFYTSAPDWAARWPGVRIDSGDPVERAEATLAWWRARGEDPRQKRIVFSDGLDTEEIVRLHARFADRVRVVFGWGTFLTNDFRDLAPRDALAPFSLVCKAVEANGRPTVKLSDNPTKAIGAPADVARYRRVFGTRADNPDAVVV